MLTLSSLLILLNRGNLRASALYHDGVTSATNYGGMGE